MISEKSPAAPTDSTKQILQSTLRFFLEQRTLVVFIILCAIFAYFLPPFLTVNNILNVLRQISITGIVAVGMTFVIITGGIDISVGSIVAVCSVIVAASLQEGHDIGIAILFALLAGTGLGLVNGVIISYGRIMPFVATLGTMYLFRGLALIITNGQAIWGLPKPFIQIGTGYVLEDILQTSGNTLGFTVPEGLGIPIPVIITFFIYFCGHMLLRRFTFGRYTLAIGGDEEAARLCGVSVQMVKLLTYGFCGLMSAVSGVVLAARLGSGQPSVGEGYELIAIAAAVIGGNALTGGKGSVWGTLLGALILGVVSNALNLNGVASFFQIVITGLIVLIAVLADKFNVITIVRNRFRQTRA